MRDTEFSRRFILVILCAAAICIPWLERPFHTRGEPREALVAQSMLTTGNWISPPAYDGAVPSKPPFSHWLIALASLPTGSVTEATSRLPSAMAVLLFAGGFFCFLAKRLSLSTATGVSLILLSSSEWFRSASTCRVDMVLATSMAGALLSLYGWWERGVRGVPWLAIVLTSCAALTKGPVGIVLPLGLFSFFCWAQSGFKVRALVPLGIRAVGLAVPVVGVVSVWYILGYFERGDVFLQKVWYENFERFTSSMSDEPHKHSFVYLLGMLVVGLVPWSVVWSWSLCRWGVRQDPNLCLKRQGVWISCRVLVTRVQLWWRRLTPLYQFSCIVAVGIVLFFGIPSSKRSVYLLPAYPFIAILLEPALRQIGRHHVHMVTRVVRCTLWFLCAALVAAVITAVVPVAGVALDSNAFSSSLTFGKVASSLMLLAAICVLWRRGVRQVLAEPVERLGGVIVGGVAIISFFIYDVVSWQLSPKQWVFLPEIQRALQTSPPPKLFSYGSEAYGASFYLAKPFSRATEGGVPTGSLVFLEQRRVAEFQANVGHQVTELLRYSSGLSSSRRDMVVLRVEAE